MIESNHNALQLKGVYGLITPLSSLDRWENWDPARLGDFLKVTYQICGKTQTRTQVSKWQILEN